MSSRGPVSPRTIVQWIVSLLVIAAVAVAVVALKRDTPTEGHSYLVEGAPDPDDPASGIVTCERTLPDVPTQPTGASATRTVAGRVTSTEVIECPDNFDGLLVVYVGEVIGDVLRRDGGAWVLMNDDVYALEVGPVRTNGEYRGYNSGLSVWVPDEYVDLIDHPGGPRWRGDVLEVQGIVHRVDPDDGGGLTIRATDVTRLASAEPVEVPVDRWQLVFAALVGLVAVGLTVYERTTRSRR